MIQNENLLNLKTPFNIPNLYNYSSTNIYFFKEKVKNDYILGKNKNIKEG
jgi:hypothetical protein